MNVINSINLPSPVFCNSRNYFFYDIKILCSVLYSNMMLYTQDEKRAMQKGLKGQI